MDGILTVLADHKITTTEFVALVVVAENPGVSQADLAEMLDVERPRIVPLLNKLEKLGLAKRTVLAGDGRVKQINLTKSGHHLMRILQKRVQEYQKKLMARLDPAEAKTIISSLWKLASRDPGGRKQSTRGHRNASPRNFQDDV
jgi:DNA-binding MarR family transcriptional regulator